MSRFAQGPQGARPGPQGGGRDRGAPSWEDVRRPLPEHPYADVKVVPFRPSPGDNLGLWLDKLVPLQKPDQGNSKPWGLGKELRSYVLDQMFCSDPAIGARGPREWRSEAGAEAALRLAESARSMGGAGLRGRVVGRLLVDHGRENSIGASLSFHHTLGVPRIPASAIKGVLRAYLHESGASEDRIRLWFGEEPQGKSNGRAGALLFLDALPEAGRFKLDLDVLTPHYQEYYRDNDPQPPGDWQSPIPFTFLTVVETTFIIHLAAAKRRDSAVVTEAIRALREALWTNGIGGKTAVGYGRLKTEELA